MTQPVALHLLRRRDVFGPNRYQGWRDPDHITDLSPPAKQTLLTNPLAGGDDEPAQFVGTLGDQVIGRMDVIPGELLIRGQPVRIYWASSLFVPPEHRKTLMGVMLVMKGQTVHHTVGSFGPSQAALPIYEKLKWSDLPLRRYIQMRRSRPVVEKYVPRALAGVAGAAADLVLLAHRAALTPVRWIKTAGVRLRHADALPTQFDEFFRHRTEPVQCHRSVAFVNWMLANTFKQDPRNRQDLFLVEGSQGELLGYVMTKVRFHQSATSRQFRNVLLGSIQDWLIVEPQRLSLSGLVMLATAELSRQKCDAIELNLPATQSYGWLKPMGFAPVGIVHFLFKSGPTSPLAAAGLDKIENWWLRPADGDNFFI